ncbi:MAG: hypothetical protein OXG13_10490 [Gemmatimonadaceae bacterium]|nr:hypothetical protein [Gemmatimonadaceae bacterium]
MSEESTNRYDPQFGRIEHYRRYPQMMPFVGRNYKKGGILLLGESHYLPKRSKLHLDAAQWYEGDDNCLDDEEKAWINTRAIVESHVRGEGTPFFRNIGQALCEATGRDSSTMIQDFSFMNAFQRPAIETKSIEITDLDTDKSAEAIRRVVEILSPGTCFFFSKKAVRHFSGSIPRDIKIEGTQHPSCAWWYSKSGPEMISGKERFVRFIRTAWFV